MGSSDTALCPEMHDVVHTLYGETMGTRWRCSVVAPRTLDLHTTHHLIQSTLDNIVAQMSTWESNSDISKYNRSAQHTWLQVPSQFMDVAECALEIAQASNGYFDPSIGDIVESWGFGPSSHQHQKPDEIYIDSMSKRSAWKKVQIDRERLSIFQPGQVHLDFSAIAKGYGTDAVSAVLKHHGIAAALVDVGGEVYGYGKKPDQSAWNVLVETGYEEIDDEIEPCVIQLTDRAIATSGDRWHRFEDAASYYSHTFDPMTATPVNADQTAISVIATSAMHADAWSTALNAMPYAHAYVFATSHAMAARWIRKHDEKIETVMTPAFESCIVV